MNTPASTTLRWVRASVLGAMVLAAGTVAHASSAGLLPSGFAMAVLYAVIVAGCAAFLGREASGLRLVGLMVGGQAFVHTALAAAAGHRGENVRSTVAAVAPTQPVAPWDPRSGESYDHWAARSFGAGDAPGLALPSWLTHAVSDVLAHPGMAVAHVLAAVLVGLWLSMGERALWALLRITADNAVRLIRRATTHLAAAPVLVRLHAPAQPLASSFLERPPLPPVWSRGPVRRGPPLLLVTR